MKIARLIGGLAALCVIVAVAVLYATAPARSFDLQDATALINRPAADIMDTYLFPSPTNSSDVVVVMDVDPLLAQPPGKAAAASPSQAFFDQSVLYTMKFDTNFESESASARPLENLVLQFAFGLPSGTAGDEAQQVYVYGPLAPVNTGTSTKLVNGGTVAGTGYVDHPFSVDSGEIQVFAGARLDPQFFDYCDFQQIFAGSASQVQFDSCPNPATVMTPATQFPSSAADTFASKNVLSIVAEIPKAILQNAGSGVVAYWATTSTTSGN